MALSKTLKRKRSSVSKFLTLPKNLITEILGRVASHSLKDLLNVKQTCKFLHDAAEDDYIFAKVSMHGVLKCQWSERKEVRSFFERCRRCGNHDMLFREGMFDYFGCQKPEFSRLEKLKTAAEKDNANAIYVYGIILLCSGEDNLKKQGSELLHSVKRLRPNEEIRRFRERTESIIASIKWEKNCINYDGFIRRPKLCGHERVYKYIDMWLEDEEKKVIKMCDYCEWSHEIDLFIKMLCG
ncbi:hypothetical protein SLA2020_072200 [Shorea laevis]